MAFESFRDWVELLEKAGELIRISHPVATELEITEIADREMKKPGGGKALLFEKPTVRGVVSPFPVAINTLGSWKRMAMSMGVNSVDEVAAELGALMKAKPPTGFKEAIKLLGLALDLRQQRRTGRREAAQQHDVADDLERARLVGRGREQVGRGRRIASARHRRQRRRPPAGPIQRQ